MKWEKTLDVETGFEYKMKVIDRVGFQLTLLLTRLLIYYVGQSTVTNLNKWYTVSVDYGYSRNALGMWCDVMWLWWEWPMAIVLLHWSPDKSIIIIIKKIHIEMYTFMCWWWIWGIDEPPSVLWECTCLHNSYWCSNTQIFQLTYTHTPHLGQARAFPTFNKLLLFRL